MNLRDKIDEIIKTIAILDARELIILRDLTYLNQSTPELCDIVARRSALKKQIWILKENWGEDV